MTGLPVPNSRLPLTVLPMTLTHLPAVFELEKQAFRSPWTLNQWIAELSREPVTVARIAWTLSLAGYALATLVKDEMHIGRIAVSSDSQRQGIGTALILDLLAWAKTHSGAQAFLEVRASNDAARKFYGALGFAELSVRRQYYCEPQENAIIMCKQIG